MREGFRLSREGRSVRTKVATLSTESIISQPSGATACCASCGAPLADDQRYCLECGERRVAMSSVLTGGPPTGHQAATAGSPELAPAGPPVPPGGPYPPKSSPWENAWQRNPALTAIAGVGVLLLAMGVGVLIGRSGSSKPSSAAPSVIAVAPSGGSSAGTGASSETFTSDWPSGTSGYTVRLQTLPQGTGASAIGAAKATATAKGAKSVGALKDEEFSSLSGSGYVIYSGVYHTRSQAQQALAGLKKSFPGATVIQVSNGSSASGSGSSSSSSSKGAGSSITHPAPPSALESLKGAKGKSYEEKSKNLPDVVETG